MTEAGTRASAVEVLRRVHRGAFSAPAISAAIRRLEGAHDPRERGLLTDLVYGTLRHQVLLDACLARRLPEPERLPPDVLNALRLGSFELLIRGTPRHAAVDQWVGVVKRDQPKLAGLVNAVLRRVELPDDLPWHLRRSLPEWIASAMEDSLGAAADDGARGMLEPEPLWLSSYAEDAPRLLREEGCEVESGPVPGSLATHCSLPLAKLEAFREGLVQPQNPASRLPVIALGPVEGEPVLDLASGNGIKSAQLAAAGAKVVAVEIDPRKIDRARRNLSRLGLEAEHVEADLRGVPDLEPAPRVLLDAPCSGSGTFRGNPEIKLRLTPEAVRDLARLQGELLETAAALTGPGGVLVYAVCSLFPQEGRDLVGRFVEEHPEFEPEPVNLPEKMAVVEAGAGRLVVPVAGLDGFFITRLKRRAQ